MGRLRRGADAGRTSHRRGGKRHVRQHDRPVRGQRSSCQGRCGVVHDGQDRRTVLLWRDSGLRRYAHPAKTRKQRRQRVRRLEQSARQARKRNHGGGGRGVRNERSPSDRRIRHRPRRRHAAQYWALPECWRRRHTPCEAHGGFHVRLPVQHVHLCGRRRRRVRGSWRPHVDRENLFRRRLRLPLWKLCLFERRGGCRERRNVLLSRGNNGLFVSRSSREQRTRHREFGHAEREQLLCEVFLQVRQRDWCAERLWHVHPHEFDVLLRMHDAERIDHRLVCEDGAVELHC